ncbi:hypothetical protein [Aeoliella sp.]|uniref:hypothetical protein n=1 Tax=Aeoliella sp. TaxID=2795800 RepID=UPI003CCBB98A
MSKPNIPLIHSLVFVVSASITLMSNSASAELISYYFRLHNADVLGFATYEIPPAGSQVLVTTNTYRTVAYPLDAFSFVWNGVQYISGESSELPYIAVRDGFASVSFSWDDVRMDAITKSGAGVEIDAALVFEGIDGQNTTLTSNALPADLTTWPHLGGPLFRAYLGNTRVLFDLNAEFGFLTDLSSDIADDDFVWVGGSGQFDNAGAWSKGKVPSVFDRAMFSLAQGGGAAEQITLTRQAVVREIGFLGDRELRFDLGGHSLSVGSEIVLGDSQGEHQSMAFEDGTVSAFRFIVGRRGSAELFVGEGATLRDPLVIAERQGSKGEVTLSGSTARWEVEYHLKPVVVGGEGMGRLSILDGSEFSMRFGLDPDTIIAESPGSVGDVLVDGLDSRLTVDGDLEVGAAGRGTLKVSNGARVGGASFDISPVSLLAIGGTKFASEMAEGKVEVEGGGSTIIAGELVVGDHGRASLSITDGGFVEARSLTMARWPSADGTILVSGPGSKLHVDSLFPVSIGAAGHASLSVQNGAEVVTRGAARVARTFGEGEPTTVTVDNASWVSGAPTLSGFHGEIALRENSLLIVQNAGDVTTGRLSADLNAHIRLDDGHLQVETLELGEFGTLSGNGTIRGDTVVDGVISPGNSPGKLSFEGDFMQLATSILRIELGRGVAGVDYDLIEVAGIATLGGTLEIVVLPGFEPQLVDRFDFFAASEVHGVFDQVRFRGGSALLTYGDTGIMLSNVVYTGVPEPRSIVLLLGLLLAGWKCRSRVA